MEVDKDTTKGSTHHEERNSTVKAERGKPSSSDGNNEYKASGLKNSLHGNVYQLKLLMLFLKRGLDKNYSFRLATEMDAAEKFDDVVFQYANESGDGVVHRFLQAKHKQDESKKISENDLLTEKDEEFSLQKYFISYRKMKENLAFKTQNSEMKDFVICTNIDICADLQSDFERIIGEDNILDMKIHDKGKEHKRLKFRKSSSLREERLAPLFRETSDLKELAKTLADHVFNSKPIDFKNLLFKKYHGGLAENVIDVTTKKIKNDFIDDSPNLSEEAKKFRRVFFKKSALSEINFKKALQTNTLRISGTFGNLVKIEENPDITKEGERTSAKTPGIVQELAAKIIDLLSGKNTNEIIRIEKKSHIIRDNIDKLAGHVFIEAEDNIVKFRREFLDGDKLPGNLNDFREALKVCSSKNGLQFTHLDEYKLRIEICTCRQEDYEKYKKDRTYFNRNYHLPNDEVTNEEINEFLDKLVLAVNQPNEIQLGNIIEAEMGEDQNINLIDSELIASLFQKDMLDWMKKKKGHFLSHEDGEFFFKIARQKISRLIFIGPTLEYRAKIDDFSIAFRESPAALETFLGCQEKQIFNLISTHKTIFSSIKVCQTLKDYKYQGNHRYGKDDSYIFIRLSSLLRMKDRVMEAFQSDLLVIECKGAEENIGDLDSQLLKAIHSNTNKKIILITEENDVLAKRLRGILPDTYEEAKDERNCLSDLTIESGEKLLEKGKVVFQGEELNLGTLVNFGSKHLIDGEILYKLIKNERIGICKEVPDSQEIESFYIDRTFNRQVNIKQGFRGENYKFHVTDNSEVDEKDLRQNQDIVLISETNAHFIKLCTEHTERNIHWLKRNGDEYVWQESFNKMGNLRDFIDQRSTDKYKAYDIFRTGCRVAILSAEPGMGKSTVLTKVARGIKEADPSLWVLRINLNDHTSNLEKLNLEANPKKEAIEFLSDITLDTLQEKRFFEHRINVQGKVALLFDGFDEISPKYKDKVIALVKTLLDTKVEMLWVTTRPHMRKTLEDELSTLSYTLEPLSRNDQETFLIKFWSNNLKLTLTNDREDDNRLIAYIQELINLLRESIADKETEFTGIPLQTRMLAEVFQDEFKMFYDSAETKPNFPKKLDVVDLYKKFMDKKFSIYFEEKTRQVKNNVPADRAQSHLVESFMSDHQKAALFTLFDERELEGLLSDDDFDDLKVFIKEVKDGEIYIGIISHCIEDRLRFVHRTFAEYLAAEYFVNKLGQAKGFLREKLFEKRNEILRNFFDRMLAKENRLKKNRKVEDGQNHFEIHTAALNNDKDKVEELLLEGNVNIEGLDKGGRTALHLAAAYGHSDVVQILLERGANVNAEDKIFSWKPLRYADKGSHLNVAELLLRKKANGEDMIEALRSIINHPVDEDLSRFLDEPALASRETVLHVAATEGYVEVATVILNKRADIIKVADDNYLTPLHRAAESGQLEVVKFLVGRNAAVEAEHMKMTPLHKAIVNGKLEVVKYLVEEGADVKPGGYLEELPVSMAAFAGHLDVIKYLVEEKGADVEAITGSKKIPLHSAVEGGHLDVVKYFLEEKKVDVNVENYYGASPLICAHFSPTRNLDIMKLLLDNGADVNTKDAEGKTLLHLAAKGENLERIRFLVKKGAPVNIPDRFGETPLCLAARWNENLDVVKLLVEEGANVNFIDENGDTLLHTATRSANLEKIKYFVEEKGAYINAEDSVGLTPLDVAAYHGHLHVVKYFVERGADVNINNVKYGYTPLHHAVSRFSNMDVVKYLVEEKGADVNATDKIGRTPLHFAVEAGTPEFSIPDFWQIGEIPLRDICLPQKLNEMKFLLGNGADVDATDTRGWTPLHLALYLGSLETVKTLVELGAGVNIPDNFGPLHIAVSGRASLNAVKFLVEQGANVDSIGKKGKTLLHSASLGGDLEIIKYLVEEKGASINAEDSVGRTPLHCAAYRGASHVVTYFVEGRGADVNIKGTYGNTPLHMAASGVIPEEVRAMGWVLKANDEPELPPFPVSIWKVRDVIKYLVHRGADVNAVDDDGRTPLHRAAEDASSTVVQYLIEEGADINAKDRYRNTPLHRAVGSVDRLNDIGYRRKLAMVKYLRKKGADLNTLDISGKTPLDIASEKGYEDLALILSGHSATDESLSHPAQHKDILKTLSEYQGRL